MLRLPFRLTPRSAIELAVTVVLGLVGLILLLGTTDEYRAGRAFNRAMDSYAAAVFEDVYDALEDSMRAKRGYDAPREVYGKLLIDEGLANPLKFAEARQVFQDLSRQQKAWTGRASLPVHVGIAVADLGAARAADARADALHAALSEARARLEEALALYPSSGDVHVNLATVALLENDLVRCKTHLDKVTEAGDVSMDALPFLYNVSGMVALREKRFLAALVEFEKVKEFMPNSDVPFVNLGAAQAQMLVTPGVAGPAADSAASALRYGLTRMRGAKGDLYARVCQALATYYVQRGNPGEAARRFAEAEAVGKLSWQSRFNQAVATYLAARAAGRARPETLAAVAADLSQAVKTPQASAHDKFVAYCMLGTVAAEMNDLKGAIGHFDRALAAANASDPVVRAALPRVHRSLGALCYLAREHTRAIEELTKAQKGADDEEKKQVVAFLKQLESAPAISNFTARRDKIFTDYDLLVGASLAIPNSPTPLGPGNVTLTLTETLSNTTTALPFSLNGPLLFAVAVNVPQGRYRVELTLADMFGNRDTAASEVIEYDREAPEVVEADPAPNATVKSLKMVRFRLKDSLNSVDVESLKVTLRYPRGAPFPSRTLVSAGRYQFPSPDGTIQRGAMATADVSCPMPVEKPVKGEHQIVVNVQDTKGKAREIEWSFTVAP